MLGTGAFSALTTSTEVKAEIATRVLIIASDLDIRWGLTTSTSLIIEQETGTALSLNGEAFFRSAIFGLQALAPGAFQIATRTITAEDRAWSLEYSANVSTQHAGTFVETAQTAGADMFNKGYDLVSIIFFLVIILAVVVGNLTISRSVWSGLIDVVLVSVLFARIGIPAVLLTFLGLVGALSWIYISAKVWGVVR